MEMHELEQAWAGLHRRLAEQHLELAQLRRRQAMDALRPRLRLVSLGQWVQIGVGALTVFFAGGYWSHHMDQIHLMIYGISVHLFGAGLLIAAILQLERLARIDYRGPVLELQRELVSLRRLRYRCDVVLMMAGFVVWVPLVFIAANALGLDVWAARPGIVLGNLAAGLAMAAIIGWLMRRFRTTFERDAAGHSLREAEADLAELMGGDKA